MPNQNEQTSHAEPHHHEATDGADDDPRQAIESGEPRIAGHQGTRIIEDDEGTDNAERKDDGRNPGAQAT